MAAVTVYTLGHSNHSLQAFTALLRRHAVTRLVDVRSQPYSRWAPQFRRQALAGALGREGIDYVFLGEALGGRPPGERFRRSDGSVDYQRRAAAADFQAGIDALLGLATERPTVILCAEEDPGHCHRRLLIAPALLARNAAVVHIRGDGRLEVEPDELQAERDRQLGLFP